ncbi:MAG: DUF1987 domain-containing protein [Bacteroidota bacterium]
MIKLEKEPTSTSPHILLDSEMGKFLIEGKSFPEDSKHFFQSTIEWIKEYKLENPKSFDLSINLYYLSSSTIISVKQILIILMDYQKSGIKVTVNWFYDEDDDDIKKTGEDYMKLTNLNFVFHINPA